MQTQYNELHEAYLMQCEAAITKACAAVMQPGSVVSEAAEYSLLNGGKRVRGVLALAVCDMLNGNMEAAAAFAAAIEMVHAFSLVHDDMPCMDNDDMRRGKPACHIAFGQANALLAGDLLAIQAFEVTSTAPATGDICARATAVLARSTGAKGMIYGQELDIQFENRMPTTADLHTIHTHKTGALILAAANLGIVAAGGISGQYAVIEQYANNLGMVFQIVDDILDVTADEKQLGKPVGSDKESGKTTFATLLGVPQARSDAQQLTQQATHALRQEYGDKAEFLCDFAEKLLTRVF